MKHKPKLSQHKPLWLGNPTRHFIIHFLFTFTRIRLLWLIGLWIGIDKFDLLRKELRFAFDLPIRMFWIREFFLDCDSPVVYLLRKGNSPTERDQRTIPTLLFPGHWSLSFEKEGVRLPLAPFFGVKVKGSSRGQERLNGCKGHGKSSR